MMPKEHCAVSLKVATMPHVWMRLNGADLSLRRFAAAAAQGSTRVMMVGSNTSDRRVYVAAARTRVVVVQKNTKRSKKNCLRQKLKGLTSSTPVSVQKHVDEVP